MSTPNDMKVLANHYLRYWNEGDATPTANAPEALRRWVTDSKREHDTRFLRPAIVAVAAGKGAPTIPPASILEWLANNPTYWAAADASLSGRSPPKSFDEFLTRVYKLGFQPVLLSAMKFLDSEVNK